MLGAKNIKTQCIMKKAFLFNCLMFVVTGGFSQVPNQINFDDTVNLFRIRIDTTLPGNIWQIGQPQKSIFSSSHSVPNAIVTDLQETYPANNTSVFYLTTPGDFPYKFHAAILYFYYKMDSDTLTDFGRIEISLDKGSTWTNILANYNSYQILDSSGQSFKNQNSGDTLIFSGKTSGWYYFTSMYSDIPNYGFDTIIYRFTFHSDNVIENRDGWMMDDFVFWDAWENVVNQNTSYSFYPNPAQDIINIRSKNQITHFEISNVMGILVHNENKVVSNFSINIIDLKPGLYMYMIKFKNGQTATGKFLKIS
ncbi:MAG: T9SS C-terminal target domain-containing protein [Bacteroidetes bacterium]|nr:MAG: T9SS C-terminal target domain-containing protein [Bacteroidota bacterium]